MTLGEGAAMRTYRTGIARKLSSNVLLLLVVACGGGGGGGGTTGGTAPVPYTGNVNPAVVTASNASSITANVIGSEETASTILGASIASGDTTQDRRSGVVDLAQRLNRSLREAAVRVEKANSVQRTAQSVIPVDQTDMCDSGSMRTSGTLNDNGTGTLAVAFNDCRIGADTLSGPATLRVDVFDFGFLAPTDFTISFTRLTLRGPGVSMDASGTLRSQTSFGMNTETVTENLVSLDNNTNETSKTENLVFVNVYNSIFNPTSFTATVSGRVFDQVHGYVDITTVTPLAFGSIAQLFPDSGQLVLTGAANRRIRTTALSASQARLELDLDGNNAYEIDAKLKWADLSGPVGADLADSDGDGMHNSWETANGLNKDDAADAALDTDNDGARSFIEYLAGTDPNDAGSVPPIPGQVINVANNSALIFDAVTQRIYVAVRGNLGGITPINPTNGTLGSVIPVGMDPVKMARSDDGQFLYVGLDGEPVVQRINLATQAVGLSIPLGSDPNSGALYFVDDMEVLPGSPKSIAVARKRKGVSPRHQGVAIYDDDVQRPAAAMSFIGSNVIAFSASAGTLYGYCTEAVPADFFRMTVDASGVSVLDQTQNLINDLGDIEFEAGLIYSTGGSVIDPQARALVGSFQGLPGIPFTISVRPDSGTNRVFFLIQTAQESIGQTATISAFDLTTRQAVGSKSIAGVIGQPGDLIRWGAKGLAFRTSGGQVFLIESPALFP